MRKNKIILVSTIAGIALAATVGVATAERGPGGHHGMRGGHGQNMFEMFDLNKDGEITRQEVEDARDVRFGETDTNGDGQISAEEMQAKMMARIEKHQQSMFERLDADKDGSLSAEEMQGGHRGERFSRMFDRVDVNDDGKITKEEADAAREKMEERHGQRHNADQ